MKFIKTIAAFMAAGLMLTATGCAAGGSKAKEAMTDAVDSYLSKVLAGKPAKKLVDAKNEAGFDNLGSAQLDLLTIVMSKSAYEITDPKPGKDEGSLTVEFKYPDLDEISSKVTDSGVDALKNAIEASDEDDLKTKKIEFKLVLKDGDWLISKKSDSKFKSFLEDIVRDFRASGTTPTTTEPDIDPTDNSGSSSGLSKVGISMPTKDLMRWKQDGDTLLKKIEEAGLETDLQYANNSVETQIAQITNMINSGCSVIIVAPIEGSSLNSVLKLAASKGIKIIAYDRLIRDTENVDYYVTFDNFEVGRLQGEYIIKALGLGEGKGPFNIEITAGDPSDNNAAFFYQGAMDVLKPYIDSGRLVVVSGQTTFEQVATGAWRTETAQARAENIIASYYSDGKNIDAWLCSNDSTALGVANALAAFYKGTYPVITGQDCDISNVKNIIAGKQAMSVFKDTRTLAVQTAKMAIQIIQNKNVDVNDTTTFNNNKKVVPTYCCQPVFVDKDNYKTILIDSGYYTEDQLS